MRTRVNGFTAWVNLRMREFGVSLADVLVDIMSGTNLKVLVESIIGKEIANVQSFDGLESYTCYSSQTVTDCHQYQCLVFLMDNCRAFEPAFRMCCRLMLRFSNHLRESIQVCLS